jgi:4'-phosphopantetheinyl transferase
LLGPYTGREPASLEIRTGAHGKPELAGSGASFNLSHSGDLALLAVALGDLQLGIDVEESRPTRPLDRMADRFFSAAEASAYAMLPASERVASFYRLWTRKEAYLKAWGTGLTFSSRRFSLSLEPGSGALLSHTEMRSDDDASAWWFEELEPGPGFAAAVCWRGARRAVRRFDYL